MSKLLMYILIFLYQIVLLLLPLFLIYSFIIKRKARVRINDIITHLGQHYFLTSLLRYRVDQQSVMIHAVSLGELDAAMNLINSFPHSVKSNIVLTVTSTEAYIKAQQLAKSYLKIVFFPYDSIMHQFLFIKFFKIRKAVIVEHDIWPNFMLVMGIAKKKVIVVNGHFSDRSIKFLKKNFIKKILLNSVEKIYVQTKDLRNKLEQEVIIPNIDIKLAPSYKLPINMSLDSSSKLLNERKYITISNFHPEEIDSIKKLIYLLIGSGYKLLLVPRHIHLFDNFIKELYDQFRIPVSVTTTFQSTQEFPSEIILIKAYGILNKIYIASHATIVCGSFDKKLKGHSLFEPALHGSMVYYGPYFSSQEYMDSIFRQGIHDIQHSVSGISKQIRESETRDRIVFYNWFIKTVSKETVLLKKHFFEVEEWTRR
ncbi:3-deoxy-D-manno-octulosonic acid transferase [Martelella alba]|uniref:3-deoxy-D-manno-octulosonic acid transferase n=1 Tax=Martelella alba TaxID=2590451 RepID=A0ABY2SGB0_9HYPH|nr:glycosyltransferase N-terminal domain-containing protein [Martelella alba]TKI04117.1 hypothetical protein FCN80_19335 [Martelella alba]